MPSADLLIPFFIAAAIFACVPGPGMIYAAAQTLALGRRAGWYSAIGFHIAGLGHIAATAFGISTLLAVDPVIFSAMKLVGAVYLIGLGITYLRRPKPIIFAPQRVSRPQVGNALRDSMIVELLNPKSALFYLAFLPQFTDVEADLPLWAQVIALGTAVNVLFTLTDLLLIELSDAVAQWLRSSERVAVVLQRTAGGALVALGVNLALTRQT
ncbi:MAG: LysE family translocator [Kiloniellales bacterium]